MASLISNIDSRKRIWLALVNLFLVLLLSLLVMPSSWLPWLIRYTTIPILAAALSLFFFVLQRQLRRLPGLAYQKRFSTGILILILAAAGFQFVHEDFGYKILMDEYNLTATSLNIHEHKTAYTPTRGAYVQGDFEIIDGFIDKRPVLFPFLVSIIHDLTGYRLENSHILNGLLTFVLFLVIYSTGFHLGGKRGGVLAVLLLAGLPLIGQNATGAGFELLNFLLLSLTVLLSLSLVERPGLEKESLLILSAVLLAHVRYESLVFLFPVVLVVMLRWKTKSAIGPGWITAFSPWLLMPLFLQNRWFRSRTDLWELPAEVSKPFSVAYVPDNIGHALMYFFNFSAEFQNSLLLTVLGGLSLFFLLVVCIKRMRNWIHYKPRDFDVLGLWGLALIGHLFLILAYHAGKLDSHFATRLGLPFHLILALAPVWLMVKEKMAGHYWTMVITGAVVFLIAFSAPHGSKAIYTRKNFVEREFRWAVEQLEDQPHAEILILDSKLSHWLSLKRQAMLIQQAKQRKEEISGLFRQGHYREVYILQRIRMDPVNERTRVVPEDAFPGLAWETVGEYISKPFEGVRLSRLKHNEL